MNVVLFDVQASVQPVEEASVWPGRPGCILSPQFAAADNFFDATAN
jgi:hypothetical protein